MVRSKAETFEPVTMGHIRLGVDTERIDVIMGDTDRTPAGLTGGSRAIAVAGAALHRGAPSSTRGRV